MSAHHLDINLRVNGEDISARVEARKTLVDFLRDDLSLTGTHIGCEHGVCGACTVRLDGDVIAAVSFWPCSATAPRSRPSKAFRIPARSPICSSAFQQRNALQCGYCTPGMLIGADALLRTAACPAVKPSASIFPAITAAAPAIRRSSMRSSPWRRRARERRDDCARGQSVPLPLVGRGRGGGREVARECRCLRVASRPPPPPSPTRGEGAASMKIADDQPSGLSALDRPNSYIGRSVPRPNLDRLTQGRGQYVSDVVLPRMVHVAFLRSPHAHARIKNIEADRRENSAGRRRGRHRRRACQGDHAVGGRAHALEGHQIRPAARHRRRSRLLAGRSGVRGRRAHAAPRRRTPAR